MSNVETSVHERVRKHNLLKRYCGTKSLVTKKIDQLTKELKMNTEKHSNKKFPEEDSFIDTSVNGAEEKNQNLFNNTQIEDLCIKNNLIQQKNYTQRNIEFKTNAKVQKITGRNQEDIQDGMICEPRRRLVRIFKKTKKMKNINLSSRKKF